MIPAFILAVLCLLLTGFCIWKVCAVMDKLRQAAERDQQFHMAEREAAFRREKFLITVLLQGDPKLADAISKLAPGDQMPEIEFMGTLPGVGEAMFSRKPV